MQTHLKTRRWRVSLGVLLVALAAMLIASPLASAHGKQSKISFSGRAFVVEVDTLLGTTIFVDTGALPASGGTLRASLSNFSENESGTQITAQTLRASITGEGTGTHGAASLKHLVINDG